jgi:hypothetical protein
LFAHCKKKAGRFCVPLCIAVVQLSLADVSGLVVGSAATMEASASNATMETPASNVFAASAGHGAMHATFCSMNRAAVSEMAMPEVAAMVVPEIAAMIEAVIGVGIVMVTSTPVVVVMIEMFVEVAEKADRSKSHEEGRIEAPSE